MLYDPAYYATIRHAAESSAQVIVPLVANLIQPRSVLDVGCGDGTWLDAWRRTGVDDYFGVDGGEVQPVLRIPADGFSPRDLTAPLDLGRRFDLVQSLEVAEHLPASAAEEFVRSLVGHGDAILFSAAIPHQGGTGHVNEQWPDYWAHLFSRAGFTVYDWVRPRIWGNDRVAWWYAQNTLLFVRAGISAQWVKRLPQPTPIGPILRLVQPRQHLVTVARGMQPKSVAPNHPAVVARSAPTPFDVAVVIPTVGRSTLERAVQSVFAQTLSGSIQILIGVDGWAGGDRARLAALTASAPVNRSVLIMDLGYSTAARNGGFTAAGTGGALRTILSYAAQSRLVAYLDDDNWWAPDHLSSLVHAVTGHDWAYSLRWYVEAQTSVPLCVDAWESVGPDAGVFAGRFGGFVDPSCLLIDKVACEPGLRLWCHPLPGDSTGMSTDRTVFAYLRSKRGVGTGQATAYYALSPSDINHPFRLRWIAQITGPSSGAPPSAVGGAAPGG
jgi:SAM-dependent methyltransferase